MRPVVLAALLLTLAPCQSQRPPAMKPASAALTVAKPIVDPVVTPDVTTITLRVVSGTPPPDGTVMHGEIGPYVTDCVFYAGACPLEFPVAVAPLAAGGVCWWRDEHPEGRNCGYWLASLAIALPQEQQPCPPMRDRVTGKMYCTPEAPCVRKRNPVNGTWYCSAV